MIEINLTEEDLWLAEQRGYLIAEISDENGQSGYIDFREPQWLYSAAYENSIVFPINTIIVPRINMYYIQDALNKIELAESYKSIYFNEKTYSIQFEPQKTPIKFDIRIITYESSGLLYGVKRNIDADYQVIFSFDLNTNIENEIFKFDSTYNSESLKIENYIVTADFIIGILYYLTNPNSTFIFKLNLLDRSIIMNEVPGMKTASPNSLVLENSTIYGIFRRGCKFGYGGIFAIDQNSLNISILYDFPEEEGYVPSNLIFKNGVLYGILNRYQKVGKSDPNSMQLYSFNLSTNTLEIQYQCTNQDGIDGDVDMILHPSSNQIICLSHGNWSHTPGVLFEYDIESKSVTIIYRFYELPYGIHPIHLIVDPFTGKVYGVTHYHSQSMFFSYDINSKTFRRYELGLNLFPYYSIRYISIFNDNIVGFSSHNKFRKNLLFQYNIEENFTSIIHSF